MNTISICNLKKEEDLQLYSSIWKGYHTHTNLDPYYWKGCSIETQINVYCSWYRKSCCCCLRRYEVVEKCRSTFVPYSFKLSILKWKLYNPALAYHILFCNMIRQYKDELSSQNQQCSNSYPLSSHQAIEVRFRLSVVPHKNDNSIIPSPHYSNKSI